jgi:putative glutamine amidotransferase
VAVTATTETRDGRRRVRRKAADVDALEQAGLVPLVVAPLGDPDAARAVLGAVHGLVLTGGEDVDPARFGAAPHEALGSVQPARDASEIALARAARELLLPTLAICRGIQLLNVALGGTLVQDLPSEWPSETPHEQPAARDERTHPVTLTPGSRLAGALGAERRLVVNSMHHQAVRDVATALVATAHAPDGVVEGAESRDPHWWSLAVQWHPEELVATRDGWDRALFAAFADAVRARRMEGSSAA